MKFSNETYDRLINIALFGWPILGTFISALFAIWGIPNGEAIAATCLAIDALIGGMLAISRKNYNDSKKTPDTEDVEGEE